MTFSEVLTPKLSIRSSIISLVKGDFCVTIKLQSSSLRLLVYLLLVVFPIPIADYDKVKRLPYADHIIVLDDERKVSEQGTFSDLSGAGGYVSSFDLSPPDWAEENDAILPFYGGAGKPEKTPFTEPTSSEKFEFDLLPEEEEEAKLDDASRRVGDTSVYLYYLKAVGWVPTLIFVVGMCGFVVCFSLPRKLFHDTFGDRQC